MYIPDENLRKELSALLNSYSRENESNTPDFILADFMLKCLQAFDEAAAERERWYGIHLEPGQSPKVIK